MATGERNLTDVLNTEDKPTVEAIIEEQVGVTIAPLNIINTDTVGAGILKGSSRVEWTKGFAAFTGAIKIELTGIYDEASMVGRMDIIVNQAVGDDRVFHIDGRWLNTTHKWDEGKVLEDTTSTTRLPVRFARDTVNSKVYIIIGETTTSWNATRIAVDNVLTNYNLSLDLSFVISTTTSLTGLTIDYTVTSAILPGLTSTVTELNKLDGFTGVAADLNYARDLKATGVTSTEFDYLDGVTSNIQTQLNTKLASDSYTAADVLTKIKTVDGTGSGLDADLLDGYDSSEFWRKVETGIQIVSDWNEAVYSGFYWANPDLTNSPTTAAVSWSAFVTKGINANNLVQIAIARTTSSSMMYTRYRNGGTWGSWSKVLTDKDTGSGNGLDADTVDGLQASSFSLTTHNHDSDYLGLSGGTVTGTVDFATGSSGGWSIESGKHWFTTNDGEGNVNLRIAHSPSELCTEAGYAFHMEYVQSTGLWNFNISNSSLAIDDTITWNTPFSINKNGVTVTENIILKGTGRIQGIDTVSDDTDAANKLYVDNSIVALGGGITGAFANSQEFTASGTFTVPDGVTKIYVEALGGGGGGGNATSTSTYIAGGSGGGSGSFISHILTVVPGSSKTVTIGAGGTSGSVGGTTSFTGLTYSAIGGIAGISATASGGDTYPIPSNTNKSFGAFGGYGTTNVGASSPYGTGGNAKTSNGNGNAGSGYGSGGGGARATGSIQTPGSYTGGVGKSGIVKVYW